MNPAEMFLIGLFGLASFWSGFCCGSDDIYERAGDGARFAVAVASAAANILAVIFISVGLIQMISQTL